MQICLHEFLNFFIDFLFTSSFTETKFATIDFKGDIKNLKEEMKMAKGEQTIVVKGNAKRLLTGRAKRDRGL